MLVHDYVEQDDGSVTRELVNCVDLGASVEPEWTVGPVDHWHQDGPEALGVILKHPRRNKFLKNGHYYVEYLTPLSAKPERSLMDFVTASCCVIYKGPMVFQQLSTARYHEPLYIYIYIYTYICKYIYICIYILIYICIYIFIYIYVYANKNI